MILNDELCMVSGTLADINSNELRYYPFMISLSKCTGSLKSSYLKYVRVVFSMTSLS